LFLGVIRCDLLALLTLWTQRYTVYVEFGFRAAFDALWHGDIPIAYKIDTTSGSNL